MTAYDYDYDVIRAAIRAVCVPDDGTGPTLSDDDRAAVYWRHGLVPSYDQHIVRGEN